MIDCRSTRSAMRTGRLPAALGAWVIVLMMTLAPLGAATGDLPGPTLDSLRSALGMYDDVRAALAADEVESLPVHASRLAGNLRQSLAAHDVGDPVASLIASAARHAETIAETDDLSVARVAFGEVSHRLLLVADLDPRLTEGWHAFVCPMAPTFQKWIQRTADLDNPYMGLAMPKCGSSASWSVPALASVEAETAPAQQATLSEPSAPSGTQPVFKPGIPGLTMVDVRDHKFLWREIAGLQMWENSNRITIAEFRSKTIEKTSHFLGLRGAAADAFANTAAGAIMRVRTSFKEGKLAAESIGRGTEFSADLAAAAESVMAELDDAPRHQLFLPETEKWLLKLAFGPKESKEAKQADLAQPSP